MAIAIGILLLALGAVLIWGVDQTVSGVDVSTIGVILMAVGGVGIFASLLVSARFVAGRTREPAWDSATSARETHPDDEGRRYEPPPPGVP
jgi:hypothetical protein